MKFLIKKIVSYAQLMRIHKPIGIYLVFWPTLWGLWLSSAGQPDIKTLVIFIAGVVLMRSAGCVINDYADRKIDGSVKRTKDRPLVTGAVSPTEALVLFALLITASFVLVLFTNTLTILLSLGAVALAFCYPFVKRHSHLPQVVLGAAFAWSIPMAFAAQTHTVPISCWLIYVAVLLWTVAYDTFYGMVDRRDDIKIGVKSTAILFGEQDKTITATLQACMLMTMCIVGTRFNLSWPYYLGLTCAAGLFVYQQYLIRTRKRQNYFKAFLNNHWVGMVIFFGIAANYVLITPVALPK